MRLASYKDKLSPKKKYRENCFTHCQKRIWERYNEMISKQEFEKLCKEIKDESGKHIYFHRQNNERQFWLLSFKNKLFWAVFDTKLGQLSTFMDMKWLESYYPQFTNATRALLMRKGLIDTMEEWMEKQQENEE